MRAGAVGREEIAVVDLIFAFNQGPADQGAVVLLLIAKAEYRFKRVDAVDRLAGVVVSAVGVRHRAYVVQTLGCTERIQIQAAFDFGALDGGVLDVVALERQLVVAGCDRIFIDEVAVLVIEHGNIE